MMRYIGDTLKINGSFILNVFIENDTENNLIADKKEKYLYFTKENLPIVLLPTPELICLASENGLKLQSFQENYVKVSTGRRKIFKGVFIKMK